MKQDNKNAMDFIQDKPNVEAKKALENIYSSKKEQNRNNGLAIAIMHITEKLGHLTDSDLSAVLSVIVRETKIKQAELEAEAKKLKVK